MASFKYMELTFTPRRMYSKDENSEWLHRANYHNQAYRRNPFLYPDDCAVRSPKNTKWDWDSEEFYKVAIAASPSNEVDVFWCEELGCEITPFWSYCLELRVIPCDFVLGENERVLSFNLKEYPKYEMQTC